MIGALILIGLLIGLFIGVYYLGSTQKTPGRRKSSVDDFYRSKGMGNVLDAREQIERMGIVQVKGSSLRRRRKRSEKP